ncbi:MAG: aminotransferase class I/II-fold pyridoxal phosphate-dependent enzyme [Chitinivibrionales bacterium]|nr:aminotransferase class I/II-fold pyridoxal phosphate-dependent enzyme [Chitinivibrionales bacterium]
MKKSGKKRIELFDGFSTRSIHAGEERNRYADSLTTPIVQTSTYTFKDSREIKEFTSKKKDRFEYGRYGNPTEKVAQQRLADLEGAEDCLIFSSGMSAITTTILALIRTGDHIIITDDAYKKTLEFCNAYLARFGVECTVVPFGDYALLEHSIQKNTRFIISESPTNPYLNIFDLEKLKKIARKRDVLTIIDSTFATPYNQRPIDFGVDLVMQSCTKYLAGHNDILAGSIAGRNELVEEVRKMHKGMGGLIDPHCCYLLLRGLKTFPLRIERQNESAMAIARFLEKHPMIRKVYYPGLKSHCHHTIARKQMRGYGGVVTFEMDGTLKTANWFLDALQLLYIAPSLGGVESLITHPATVSYYDYSRKERYSLGITDTLIRLAAGVEDCDDIINDLRQALDYCKSRR